MLRKLLFALSMLALQTCTPSLVHAQTVVIQRPDCQLALGNLTAAAQATTAFDNRVNGCTFWAIVYNSNGFSALSLVVQTAPDAGGVPGSWSTYTAATGANPNTTTTQNSATFGTSYFPWVRTLLSSKTGTGTITGNLYGWRYPPPATISAIIGVVTVIGNKSNNAVVPGSTNLGVLPCIANAAAPTWTETFQVGCSVDLAGNQRMAVVTGQTADGVAATGNPVRIAGKDLTGATQDIATGTGGGVYVQQAGVAMSDAFSNDIVIARGVADGASPGSISTRVLGLVYNGNGTVGWDRYRSASLTNFPAATTTTARNSIGAAQFEKPSRWTAVSAPATSNQATASIAAEANVRHVVDSVCFAASSSGAVTAAQGTVNIRDGATGAGTIIWSMSIAHLVAAAAGVQTVPMFCTPPGLTLVGTTNTAMTAEFSALVTNESQSVTMTGFNVN